MDRHTLYRDLCKDLPGMYVEVGTCLGGFAKFLLDSTPCFKLFCVDPYMHFENDEYKDALNGMTQQECDMKFHHVQYMLKAHAGDRVHMLRLTSSDAANMFPDGVVDFVYIDANHEYKYVKEDIMAWIPKLRGGGILAGDDVESLDLPHTDKNAHIQHTDWAFGLYGVHTALVDIKQENPWFNYTVEGGQFWWRKR
jgi:predicted O-methyltransferase YrrM